MSSLTQPYEAFEKPGLVVSYKMAAVKIYKGALVAVNSAGYVAPIDPATASMRFVGVANETVDNSTGSAGSKSINLTKCGAFVLKAAAGYSPTIADLGSPVYAVSDWEVQTASSGLSNAYRVGTITNVESTSTGAAGVRVRTDAATA